MGIALPAYSQEAGEAEKGKEPDYRALLERVLRGEVAAPSVPPQQLGADERFKRATENVEAVPVNRPPIVPATPLPPRDTRSVSQREQDYAREEGFRLSGKHNVAWPSFSPGEAERVRAGSPQWKSDEDVHMALKKEEESKAGVKDALDKMTDQELLSYLRSR